MSHLKINTMKQIKLLAVLFFFSLAFISCSDDDNHDDHDHEHEEELITTVVYTLTNTNDATDVITLTFEDLDGEGGADGTYTVNGEFTVNSSYTGEITLWNGTENPAEDVTEEIENEGNEHEFFFSNTASLTITKTDNDGNGNPLGLKTTVNTGDTPTTGTVTVILKHEPTKPNDGTVENSGGVAEIDVTFNVSVNPAVI